MFKILCIILSLIVALLNVPFIAEAAKDFDIKNNTSSFMFVNGTSGNVGIGTITPQGAFVVTSGNVGIGTWASTFKLMVIGTGFFSDSLRSDYNSGGALYLPYGSVYSGGNVDNYFVGNVGIGTATPQGALVVTKGNVGIGTWTATERLIVRGGNVGIGSANAPQALYVAGTMEGQAFKLNQNASAGYVLTSTSTGIGTWMPNQASGGGSSQWTTTNTNDVYLPSNGNVGLGTTLTSTSALTVMNGNVGIGTWVPTYTLEIENSSVYGLHIKGPAIGTYSRNLIQGQYGAEIALGSNSLQAGSIYADDSGTMDVNGTNGVRLIYYFSSEIARFGVAGGAMRSYINGNLGVGTTVPASGLSVAGGIGIGTGVNSTYVSTTAPVGGMIVQGNVGIGTWTAANGRLSVIGGNVGIGTATTHAMLEVTGDGAKEALRINASGPNDVAPPLIIHSNGAVGIGTSNTNNTSYYYSAQPKFAVASGTNSIIAGFNATGNGTYGIVSIKGEYGARIYLGGAGGYGGSLDNSDTTTVTTLSGNGGVSLDSKVGIGTNIFSGAGLSVMSGNVGIGTWIPSSGLNMKTSFAVYRTTTAVTATTAGQTIIGVTSTAAARTIHLATADRGIGRIIIVKDESGGAATNNITVDGEGGETIDGAASVTISANYGVLRVYSNGTNWFTF